MNGQLGPCNGDLLRSVQPVFELDAKGGRLKYTRDNLRGSTLYSIEEEIFVW